MVGPSSGLEATMMSCVVVCGVDDSSAVKLKVEVSASGSSAKSDSTPVDQH